MIDRKQAALLAYCGFYIPSCIALMTVACVLVDNPWAWLGWAAWLFGGAWIGELIQSRTRRTDRYAHVTQSDDPQGEGHRSSKTSG